MATKVEALSEITCGLHVEPLAPSRGGERRACFHVWLSLTCSYCRARLLSVLTPRGGGMFSLLRMDRVLPEYPFCARDRLVLRSRTGYSYPPDAAHFPIGTVITCLGASDGDPAGIRSA